MADTIIIRDLLVRCVIGIQDWEREVKQDVRINLDLETDAWLAGESDDFRDTVDYKAITEFGDNRTNYQLMPGDRLLVAEDRLIAADTYLAKLFSPLERAMGFSLLTVGTVTRFSGSVLSGGGAQGIFNQGF